MCSHNFMLRCTPFVCESQKVIKHNTSVIPNCLVASSLDNFGNIVHTGYIADRHEAFMFESTGIIETTGIASSEPANAYYRYPSSLTMPSAELQNVLDDITTSPSIASEWMEKLSTYLHSHFKYKSGTTNVRTTAAEALIQGTGVCQDFAHISIAICRMAGIPARYVNGFMIGEGETHAWIEYYSNGRWNGFDPTNDRPVDDTYIKIAQGRDFNDCSINRGRFNGITEQSIKVSLSVEKLKHLPQSIYNK